ncbi:MAG: hypothetical protein JO297_04935 [Nitrososphaeraceae archaeon]|nr:hypothetical protein [Nitrososphaeraceae archaeon]
MTIQELADNPQSIQDLYNALRNGMQPESKSRSSSRLSYNKAERENELIENIAEIYNIDKKKAKAKIITGRYDDGVQSFNYILEVVAAPKTDTSVEHAGEVEFIGNINSTPSIDGGEGYFQDADFKWIDTKKGKKKVLSASGIRGLLHECGFNTSGYYTSKKKKPSIFLINLKTPCPDWLGSADKTKIDLRPYADDIVKAVSSLARNVPSYHGEGYGYSNSSSSLYASDGGRGEDQVAINYLVDFLKKRYHAIQAADPSLKNRDRITQSGVWYRIRPIMISSGFQPPKDWGTTRRYITGKIDEVCQELFGVDREEMGIIASARAVMYFQGQSYPVNVDNVAELAEKGIVIIIIEKEGIADLLEPYADKYKIALVYTRGRFTKYGKELIEAAKKSAGSVIGILVDYDVVGEAIAKSSITQTPRIGITRETITWLQENGYSSLTEADVEEEYIPSERTDDPYLNHKRIELDSIVAKVGAEALWKYIMYRLQLKDCSPEGFDYNRVISMPANETFHPAEFRELQSSLDEYFTKLMKDDVQDIESDLEHVTDLVEVEHKERQIHERLGHIVSGKSDVKLIIPEFSKLTN